MNRIETKMKRDKLFPLDSLSVNQGEILRIAYMDGKAIDSSFCNIVAYAQDSKRFDELDYHQSFAKGIQIFKTFKVYRYKNETIEKVDGIEYIIIYDGVISNYYFKNSNFPKDIIEMDSLILEEGILIKRKKKR